MRAARVKAGGKLVTPWGKVEGHDHGFRLSDVRGDDKAVFAVRDPISRFLSSYYSRFRKGAPRYFIEWTPAESKAFRWFDTPQALADALAEPSGKQRERAEFAMKSIRHVNRPMTEWLGSPRSFRRNIGKVLYIARQETLAEDWERLKELLDFPRDQMLPDDPLTAHRTEYDRNVEFSDEGRAALRAWYADDYELLAIAEDFRSGRMPTQPSRLGWLASLPLASRLADARRSAVR
jgi:hypothetical protein